MPTKTVPVPVPKIIPQQIGNPIASKPADIAQSTELSEVITAKLPPQTIAKAAAAAAAVDPKVLLKPVFDSKKLLKSPVVSTLKEGIEGIFSLIIY